MVPVSPLCGNISGLEMTCKGTYLSVQGLTADNANPSKNQALRLKEQPAELRHRIVLRHRSGEGYKKGSIKGSQDHSDFHNSSVGEVWKNQDPS